MQFNLAQINADLGNNPIELIKWALDLQQSAICTTNFRPFEAVILHMVTSIKPDVPIIWLDSGYNTAATYKCAQQIIEQLGLNLKIYLPKRSRAHREALEGPAPALHDPRHTSFTEEVKLEPFARMLLELKPKIWFTALRAADTANRAQMQPASLNPDGILKIAPLLNWSSKDLYQYLEQHNLPNNFDYFDPTKLEENRECGLHLTH